jgi:hypothetical protein
MAAMSTPVIDGHESEPVVDQGAPLEKPFGNAVFISADNRVLHVGSVEHVLDHLEVKAPALRELRRQLPEIYDSSGHRLTIVEPERDRLELARIGDQDTIDEQLLIDRINLALARMQVDVHANDKLREFRVPRIDGDLRTVLAGLAEAFSLGGRISGTVSKCHDASAHPHFP